MIINRMYIDTHVHLRDFNQKHTETVKHGLELARDSGLDAVFDLLKKYSKEGTFELI